MTKKIYHWLPLFGFAFFVTLGNLLSSTILLIVALISFILQLIISSNEENFYLTIFLIPNIRILDGLGYTFLINVLMAIPLLIYFFKSKAKLRKINVFALLSTITLFLIEFIHICFLENYSNLFSTASCFLIMLYCLIISIDNITLLKMKSVWMFLVLGILFTTISYLICNIEYFSNIISSVVDGNRFVAYADDPNYFSLYICLALALLFIFENHKVYHFIIMFLLIIIGLLTGSKMCILLMTFILVVGFFYNIFQLKNKKRIYFSITMCAMIIVAAIIFNQQLSMLFDNFLRRMGFINNNFSLDDLTTGRLTILRNYTNILENDFLTFFFGKGLQYPSFLNEPSGKVAHNTYFDLILSWGIFGLIVFIFILYSWIKKIPCNTNNKKIILFLPCISLIINFLDLSCLSASMFWLILIVAILPLKAKLE